MDWTLIFEQGFQAGVGPIACYTALAAIGLNMQFGYTGLLNFGQAAFAAMGAYGLAVAVATYGLSFWTGIFFGLLAAVLLALVLGFPTLRLRADYLAIVTIAASEIIRLVVGPVLRDQPAVARPVRVLADQVQRARQLAAHRRLGPRGRVQRHHVPRHPQ